MMATLLVGPRVRRIFGDIGDRRLDRVLAGLADDVHHRFAGEHPLGGERHTRAGVEAWFARLFRLFPVLTFTVHDVRITGPLWNLRVCVEWTAHVEPQSGPAYENVGAHVIRIQRGRVTHLHAYEDSQAVVTACAAMARDGIEEASAAPIRT